MSLIIAGTVRIPPENLEAFRGQISDMLAASRAEPGCIEYNYAIDVQDPGLVRVFEVWSDHADLEAHFKSDHMARWREAWPRFGVSDRRLTAYEIADSRPI
ncbi:MAG TPA: putative quinol monooxygenase [Caulobacteraceae bacterium]